MQKLRRREQCHVVVEGEAVDGTDLRGVREAVDRKDQDRQRSRMGSVGRAACGQRGGDPAAFGGTGRKKL